MGKIQRTDAAPDAAWREPVTTWVEILDRYATFLQVRTWRASVKRDGGERAPRLSPSEAGSLRNAMLNTLERGARGKSRAKAKLKDLDDLRRRLGRHIPRSERCPSKLQVHFQRAFLLNASGYTCSYCHRTAWGVYAEDCGEEPRRTLRFEVDHRMTRRSLTDPKDFDARNLVAACRSCNVVKAEMPERRFLFELGSLSRAVKTHGSAN